MEKVRNAFSKEKKRKEIFNIVLHMRILESFSFVKNTRKRNCTLTVKDYYTCTIVTKMLRRFYYVTTVPCVTFFFRFAYARQ